MKAVTEQREDFLVDLGDVTVETKGDMPTGLPDDFNGLCYSTGALSDE